MKTCIIYVITWFVVAQYVMVISELKNRRYNSRKEFWIDCIPLYILVALVIVLVEVVFTPKGFIRYIKRLVINYKDLRKINA